MPKKILDGKASLRLGRLSRAVAYDNNFQLQNHSWNSPFFKYTFLCIFMTIALLTKIGLVPITEPRPKRGDFYQPQKRMLSNRGVK